MLKSAPQPVEKPINPLNASTTRRQGMPAIGIPADKMAAFLNEMKTVRLRKVSQPQDGNSSFQSTSSGNRSADMSISELSSLRFLNTSRPESTVPRSSTSFRSSTSSGQSRSNGSQSVLGDKRKRDVVDLPADPRMFRNVFWY